MTATAHGALGVWHGVASEQIHEAEHWYNHQHHAERVAIPDFLRARRYVNIGAGLRYFSRYDVNEAAVLASGPYVEALNNPTPWSQRIFPHYRDTVRGAFDIVARAGVADGGAIVSLRWAKNAGADLAALDGALDQLPGRMANDHGILRAEVWRIDEAVTVTRTREKELRAKTEDFPARVLLVDAMAPEPALAALERHLPPALVKAATVDAMKLVFHLAGD